MYRVSPLVILGFCIAAPLALSGAAAAEMPGRGFAPSPIGQRGGTQVIATVDDIIAALASAPLTLTDAGGRVIGSTASVSSSASVAASGGGAMPLALTEQRLIALLKQSDLTAEQAQVLWELFADQRHVAMARPEIIAALVKASTQPQAREAMWSELSGLARATRQPASSGNQRSRQREAANSSRNDLIDVFERNRDMLRPLLGNLREREAALDDIVEIMRRTLVFGASADDAAAYVSYRQPAAVARHMERERGLGRPAPWEDAAFRSILRWKSDRLVASGDKRPRTAADADGVGRDYIVVFNCLHWFDEGHRDVMLAGLGPETLFNAVVAGEKELYRLGTSSYRNFLHAAIMAGVAKSGSFEAFVESATSREVGERSSEAKRRGIVFLRVAAAFGLLESVLTTIRDREHFIADTIAAVDDPKTFEANSAIVLDVLQVVSTESAVAEFKHQLVDSFYRHYRAETRAVQRAIYGSVLSVYQTVVGNDDRDPGIDRAFPLDDAAFRIPFERLFGDEGDGIPVHRVLMRLDRNDEDAGLYADFRARMKARGASVSNGAQFDVFRIANAGRAIEIYVNRPSTAGLRRGIAGIADAVGGKRVGTVIGRGHTSIIAPLQTDAKLVLGDHVKDVATVIVGTCGGDASVRDLIGTFGYIPLISTAATGRQVINDAIEARYIDALMSLQPGGTLVIADVVAKAIAPFRRRGTDQVLRSDAAFYHVNMASVHAARLFDQHVKPLLSDVKTASGE